MILVSGATGTIGSALVKQLREAGDTIRILVRDAKKAESHRGARVEVAVGDLASPTTLGPAMKGVSAAFLLTNPDPRQAELQRNFIQAAKQAGVRHVVKSSTLGASLDSPIAIARWHAETERDLAASGLDWTLLQPHAFMQNLLASAGTIKGQGVFYGAMRDGAFSTVDARDIAAVAAAILRNPGAHRGKTHVVTGPEALTQAQMAEKLSAAIGKQVRYVDLPPEELKKGLLGMGMPEWYVDDLVSLSTFFATGQAAMVVPTVEQVAKKKPNSFDDFARDHAAAFRG